MSNSYSGGNAFCFPNLDLTFTVFLSALPGVPHTHKAMLKSLEDLGMNSQKREILH